LNASADGILIADSEGNLLEGNPQIGKLLGYSNQELTQLHFTQLHPPEELENVLRCFGKEIADTLVLCKDGSIKPVEITSSIFNVNGKTLVQGIFRDISQRKKIEEERQNLLQELTGFKRGLDQAAVVSITDTDGVITYVNQKFVEVSGYSERELLGQTHFMSQSEKHSASFFQNLWNTINHGKVWRDEICNLSKDSSVFWIDTTIVPLFDIDGKPESFLSIGLVVTKQKESEIALQESQQFLETILNTFPLSVFWKNRESQYLGANSRFLEDAGLNSVDELVGKNDFDL